MRERLISLFVGLTVLVVALYGIPRAYLLADLVRTQEHERVERTVGLIATVVARTTPTPARLDRLTAAGERITVTTAGGKTVTSTDGSAPEKGDISVSHRLRGGGTVTVTRGADAVNAEIADELLPLLLLGLALVMVAGLAGFVIARRLARPFQELAVAAHGLGSGQLHPDLPPYRVPEAQAIADALRTSGEKIDVLLSHERELAVHASHELRTPLTALRLDLEDLALWKETPPTVAAQLERSTRELDRLSEAIARLLAHSRDQAADGEMNIDLDALLAEVANVLNDRGLPGTHAPSGTLPTRLDPQLIEQAVELLAADAEEQGALRLRLAASDSGSHLEVRLSVDLPAGIRDGSDRWTIANELVTALGGHLVREPGGDVVARLPKRAPADPA